jgi:CrcB protein
MFKEIGLLALAGAAGTLCRYGLAGAVQKLSGAGFPWGTLTVNAAGCLLFGFVWTLGEERLLISGQTRFIVLTGFMGAFTTFSTFAFETGAFLQESSWRLAAGNLAANNAVGLICLFLGLSLGRFV